MLLSCHNPLRPRPLLLLLLPHPAKRARPSAHLLACRLLRPARLPAGIPAEEQRVMFGGRQLEDAERLEACGVSDDSQMYVLMRLLGGAKKRKKKTYTKPKKQKHK